MVDGVEIRIETLFLLVLEEAGTLVFLIAELDRDSPSPIPLQRISAPGVLSFL